MIQQEITTEIVPQETPQKLTKKVLYIKGKTYDSVTHAAESNLVSNFTVYYWLKSNPDETYFTEIEIDPSNAVDVASAYHCVVNGIYYRTSADACKVLNLDYRNLEKLFKKQPSKYYRLRKKGAKGAHSKQPVNDFEIPLMPKIQDYPDYCIIDIKGVLGCVPGSVVTEKAVNLYYQKLKRKELQNIDSNTKSYS